MSNRHFVVDTNIWLYVVAGIPSATQFLIQLTESTDTEVYYSAITAIEIFSYPDLSEEKRRIFEQLLSVGKIIPVDQPVALTAAQIRSIRKRETGKNLKLADACVAATALLHEAVLVTNDSDDFKNIDRLNVKNPVRSEELE